MGNVADAHADLFYLRIYGRVFAKLEAELEAYLDKWQKEDMADHGIIEQYEREVWWEKIRRFKEGKDESTGSYALTNKYLEELRTQFWYAVTGTTFTRNPVHNFFRHPDYFPKLNSDHRRWMKQNESDYRFCTHFIDASQRDVIGYLAAYFAHDDFYDQRIRDRQKSTLAEEVSAKQNPPSRKSPLRWKEKNKHKLSKADLIRLLAALWRAELIVAEDGEPASQIAIIQEFADLLQVDISRYSDALYQAAKAQERKNARIFNVLKEEFLQYVKEKEENKYSDS